MSENEKKKILDEHELSTQEMNAVSGGVKIDWPADCKATVENGSNCWGTDACYGFSEQYMRDRNKHGCSATVAATDISHWCSSNDACEINEIRYAFCDSNWREKGCNMGIV